MITGYIIGVPKATTRNLSFCATHSSIVAIIQKYYILAAARIRKGREHTANMAGIFRQVSSPDSDHLIDNYASCRGYK